MINKYNHLQHNHVLDIIRSDSRGSCCITKSYGRFVEGTGSILQTKGSMTDLEKVYEEVKGTEDDNLKLQLLKSLGLRFLSPKEIARLMGFPDDDFDFPSDHKTLHCYRVLGNSLNVDVVSKLLGLLFMEEV